MVLWSGATALATVGMLVVAVVASVYAKRQWESSREQIEDSRRAAVEASRPYVTATLEASAASEMIQNLVVRNVGQRPALEVTVHLTPPPVRAREAEQHRLADTRMLNEPIAMLAPGQELKTFFDSSLERQDRTDLPDRYEVELRYKDSSDRMYIEHSVLDVAASKGALTVQVRSLHDLAVSVQKIERILNGASALARRGYIQADAVIEGFAENESRLAAERARTEQAQREFQARFVEHRKEGSAQEDDS
jgi:hypothetical protein